MGSYLSKLADYVLMPYNATVAEIRRRLDMQGKEKERLEKEEEREQRKREENMRKQVKESQVRGRKNEQQRLEKKKREQLETTQRIAELKLETNSIRSGLQEEIYRALREELEYKEREREEQKKIKNRQDQQQKRQHEKNEWGQREQQAEQQEREQQGRQQAKQQGRERNSSRQTDESQKFENLRGIRPLVWPTEEQFQSAKQRVQYNDNLLHFAICGASGSGKSSLINALRGIRSGEYGSASVGTSETTRVVTRYPDPHHPKIVWYDIPGAGTLEVPSEVYFNDQGLFCFDFIVLVYDVRFTQIDVDILKNCGRFNIPTFIVRSKADQHIDNIVKNSHGSKTYEDARTEFQKTTQEDAKKNLTKFGYFIKTAEGIGRTTPRCYIVSSYNLFELTSGTGTADAEYLDEYLDEEQLLKDFEKTAYSRRFNFPSKEAIKEFTSRKAKAVISTTAAFFKAEDCQGWPATVDRQRTAGDQRGICLEPTVPKTTSAPATKIRDTRAPIERFCQNIRFHLDPAVPEKLRHSLKNNTKLRELLVVNQLCFRCRRPRSEHRNEKFFAGDTGPTASA